MGAPEGVRDMWGAWEGGSPLTLEAEPQHKAQRGQQLLTMAGNPTLGQRRIFTQIIIFKSRKWTMKSGVKSPLQALVKVRILTWSAMVPPRRDSSSLIEYWVVAAVQTTKNKKVPRSFRSSVRGAKPAPHTS